MLGRLPSRSRLIVAKMAASVHRSCPEGVGEGASRSSASCRIGRGDGRAYGRAQGGPEARRHAEEVVQAAETRRGPEPPRRSLARPAALRSE